MVNTKALTMFNKLRPISIGFDDLFSHFEQLMDNDFNVVNHSFPFYNIKQTKDNNNIYKIQMALAGYSKKDIEVEYENNILTVKSVVSNKDEDEDVLYQGITKKYFNKAFTISDDVKVNSAELIDGLLTITLERIVPEAKAKRTIKVQ